MFSDKEMCNFIKLEIDVFNDIKNLIQTFKYPLFHNNT